MRRTALLLLAASVLTVGLFTGTATAADDHYTDGTVGADVNGNNWGPPPEAPHFNDLDGTSNLCIDPPGEVWMTLHSTNADALTFQDYPRDAVTIDGTQHKCINQRRSADTR